MRVEKTGGVWSASSRDVVPVSVCLSVILTTKWYKYRNVSRQAGSSHGASRNIYLAGPEFKKWRNKTTNHLPPPGRPVGCFQLRDSDFADASSIMPYWHSSRGGTDKMAQLTTTPSMVHVQCPLFRGDSRSSSGPFCQTDRLRYYPEL